MNRFLARGAAAPLCLWLAACSTGEDRFLDARDVMPPVALDTAVAFLERTSATVFLMDPADPDLRPRLVAVATDPAVAVRRQGQDELLVLSRGERGGPGVAPRPAELAVVPADAAKAPRSFVLGSRFNALAQSPDGRFVVTHYTQDTNRAEVLFNPNEIAIIDLASTTPGAAAVARTIRSFDSVPLQVVFSPRLSLPEGPRTLAVILSRNYVTLLDLDHLDRSEITVPLTLPDDQRSLRPAQVLFDTKDSTIYVRAEGANDIYALALTEVPAAERVSNDFRPALSQLGAGTQPSDMALYAAAEGTRLVVVSAGSNDVSVIDARSSRTTRIPLGTTANRLTIFDATGPGDPKTRTRALLMGAGLESRVVSFLDLDRVEEQGTRNLDSRTMSSGAADVHVFAERGLAIALHRTGAGGAGISVIDLARRTVAPIFAEVPLEGVTLGGPMSDQVWIAPVGSTRLGFLNLKGLQAGEVRLDAPVGQVLPLGKSKDGRARLVVVHPSTVGRITVLDADKPDRATARTATGFLLTDLLQRGEP